MTEKIKLIGVRIPQDMYQELQAYAEREYDGQVSMTVRIMIRNALRRQSTPEAA